MSDLPLEYIYCTQVPILILHLPKGERIVCRDYIKRLKLEDEQANYFRGNQETKKREEH